MESDLRRPNVETINTRTGRRKAAAPKPVVSRNSRGKVSRVIGVKLKSTAARPAKKIAANAAKPAPQAQTRKANVAKERGKVIVLPLKQKVEEPAPPPATPSAAMLKSFRVAAKQRQEQAKKHIRAKAPGKGFLAAQPKAGKRYSLDLRIHSPATKGYFATAGVETASALVRLAKVKGIDVIGLTDYYSASYVDAVQVCATDSGVTVIPGFDMRCPVGICPDLPMTTLLPENCRSEEIYQLLELLGVPSEMFGSKDFSVGRELGEVIRIIEDRGGVLIPSRVDKTPRRQSTIPMLVERFGFHTFDLVHPENTTYFSERWPNGGFTFVSFSNANALAQVGSRVAKLRLTAPGFAGIQSLVKRRAR